MFSLFPPLRILPVKRRVCPYLRSFVLNSEQARHPHPLTIRTDAPARSHVRLAASIHPTPAALIIIFNCINIKFPLQAPAQHAKPFSSVFIFHLCIVELLNEGMPSLSCGSCDKGDGRPDQLHTPAIKFPSVAIEV